jgi:hypothetical protein
MAISIEETERSNARSIDSESRWLSTLLETTVVQFTQGRAWVLAELLGKPGEANELSGHGESERRRLKGNGGR